ncbi:MAG: Alkylhydroperoxidase AhpD domain protein [uncultured Thermomicrobiales bacterium]|uniref:Alkylhydroperoxidase AhpD domain protein n=1 Tax=uncultured Thermomicrobiales bacterium TaxID=1645740 RepID=A0A6J4UN85_9BACT|nr:MAG: Alkylhydroperoxidase AhpD domain protein [uncultured Thermomicrobiales bacterium]
MTQGSSTATAADTAGGTDVIDHLLGIKPGSKLAQLRAERPVLVKATQGSHEALFEPDDLGGVSHRERDGLVLRVAVLTPSPELVAWHRERLRAQGEGDATIAAFEGGPGGAGLTTREVALLRHADILANTPGEATPDNIAALKAAGFGPRDIVTISQLIAFVSFQARLLVGLRLVGEGQ